MLETIQIRSLTPLYDKVEDRIRLCANYQDMQSRIDFMVTRAFMINLLFSLDEYLLTYYSNKIITKDTIESTVDTTQTSKTKSKTSTKIPLKNITNTVNEDLELYGSKEDLLVNLQLQYHKDKQLTTMEFTSKNNHQASLVVDAISLQQILWSIKRAIPSTSWGILTN